MSLSKSLNLAHAQTVVPCDVCEDEAPGQYYCKECKQTLCSQCEKYHRRSALSKDHNVVLRTQIGDVDLTVLCCTDHGDEASFHCEKCNIAVCSKCITGKHKEHPLSDLPTIFEKEKKLLQTEIRRIQTENLPELKKRQEDINTAKEKYEKKIDQITKEMEGENQALLGELEKRQEERIKNLASIRDSQLKTFEGYSKETKTKIDLYEERISEYQDAIGKNTLPALRNVKRSKQSLPEIGSESLLPRPPTFVPGNINTIGESLGKLHVSSLKLTTPTVVSEFKCPLQGLLSICITKEGDVWLGGDESREILQVNIKGRVLRIRPVQRSPSALDVMNCGDIIISYVSSDSRSVSKLLNNDTKNIVFGALPCISYGVSVTADQRILICTRGGEVMRSDNDGTNIKEIYKGPDDESAFHAVENADGNIYISDVAESAVVIVSKDGKVLSTITHTTEGQKLGGPRGLVVDKMGNVLCADHDNHCVYIIDQNQQMRELVGRSHGILQPIWLALDGDHNLWITEYHGTVLVVKCYSP